MCVTTVLQLIIVSWTKTHYSWQAFGCGDGGGDACGGGGGCGGGGVSMNRAMVVEGGVGRQLSQTT